ncbi:aldehyde dehydrogenase family protein, partial [Mesorhizobium sp. M2D.F.Ca.ET.160.01.1.1]
EHPDTLPLVPIARGEGAWLIDHDGNRYLDAVSSWWTNLFGHAEPRIGGAIAAQAGQALKKVVLELGGSDPFIVLADADLDAAVEAAVASRFQNTGQVCIAGKRSIVEDAVYDRCVAQFCQKVQALTIGDGREAGNRIGPMARQDLLEQLDAQVRASVDAGAKLLVGGHQLDRPGAFYAP